jgi:hypothetical protein
MFHLVNGQVATDAEIDFAMGPKDVIRGFL